MQLLCEIHPGIRSLEGKIYFVQREPYVHPEPVLIPDPDPSVDSAGATLFGTVLEDAGKLRMWYHAWPFDWDGKNPKLVAYAESEDGIQWNKPNLNMVDYGGKKNNLCNLHITSPSVFVDPHASGKYRYRATGWSSAGEVVAGKRVTETGYFTAHSADGIFWELDSDTPQWEGSDVITNVYHPGRDRGVAALKRPHYVGGVPRRSIWNAELVDGVWSPALSSLIPDEFDDVCAQTRGFASGDYYGMGMMPAGSSTVGFIWQFRHSLPRTSGTRHGVFGSVDVTLAYQHNDGDRWIHVPGRNDFLRHGSLSWNRGGMYTASSPVDFENEQRLYFNGSSQSHGWYVDAAWKISDRFRHHLIKTGIGRIGYASWPKYRLMGYRADPEGSFILDLGNIQNPWKLYLNLETENGGLVRPELLHGDGTIAAKAAPMTGNRICEPVRWGSNGSIGEFGHEGVRERVRERVRIRMHMERATVYAYEIRDTR